MKKNKDTEKKYGYFSNLFFVISNQWKFDKSGIIAAALSSPMRAVSAVAGAFLPKIILDCIEKKDTPLTMLVKVGVVVLLTILAELSSTVPESFVFRSAELAGNQLYQDMLFRKTMDMDYNNYIYNETRQKKEKAAGSLKGWSGNITHTLPINMFLFSSFFGFSSFTVIIASCNILFIPILVASYSLSSLGWMLLQKYNDRKKDERSAVFLKLGYLTFKSKDFTDAKDIRVYNMSDFLYRKTVGHLRESQKYEAGRLNGHFLNVFFENFLKFAISIGAYVYLIKLKLTTDMSLGDFTLYFGAITGFGSWLGRLVDSITDSVETDHCINDFRNFLDMKDSSRRNGGLSLPVNGSTPYSIELKNLSFSYENAETPTLKNINLLIRPGEKTAVVGVNGAGKSTLVKLICGLFVPTEGEILINGSKSTDFNRDDYYRMFTTVFQDVSLLPASIAKNIALCPEDEIDRDRLFRCMRLAGIDEKVSSFPEKENSLLVREINRNSVALSGGELQRLILARALYKEAPVIILDEPTAALDPIAENNMYLKYNELTEGKTSVYISHRLSSTRFCDRIIFLENGEITETGTHEELIALGGKYAEMFAVQSKYYRDGGDGLE